MRRIAILLLAFAGLAACQDKTSGDAVRATYENSADAVDRQAAVQPTETARKIYRARAAAIRAEGKDREKALEGGSPSGGPGNTAL